MDPGAKLPRSLTVRSVSCVALVVGLADSSIANEGIPGHGCLGDPAHADQAQFHAESAAAMERMMSAMAVPPTGDIDTDFAAMMIAHHQGAIDMAMAELRHGKNEQLRRIAQEIIVEQQQEITAMRLAAGKKLRSPPVTSAPPGQLPAATKCE